MKLTEDDPDLALRGYLIGALKMLPTDPRLKHLQGTALMYTVHWIKKYEEDQWEKLTKLLGLNWKAEDIIEMNSEKDGKKKPDGIFLPLSFIIQPKMPEMLKKLLGTMRQQIGDGSYKLDKDEEVVELGDLDKATFKKILGAVSPAMGVQVPKKKEGQ